MYRRILLPLDGSRFAEQAVPLALGLAGRAGADLHLVMVAEPSGPTASECEEYLQGVAGRMGEAPGGGAGRVSTAVRAGHIVGRLREELETFDADATVMATHGRGGLSRLWVGSIAMGFLHETDRPLILVRPGAGGAGEVVPEALSKLLVPIDGSHLSECVLEHAVGLGALFDAAFHLTRVVSPPVDTGSPYAAPTSAVAAAQYEEAERTATDYLARCAESLRARGHRVTASVIVDMQPGRGILRAADETGCDGIAMATHGRVGLARALLGSATDKVLRGSRVPLLLCRPDGGADAR